MGRIRWPIKGVNALNFWLGAEWHSGEYTLPKTCEWDNCTENTEFLD